VTAAGLQPVILQRAEGAAWAFSLFELQAWLGHQNPATTQHYAKITPNTLAKAYTEAGDFARNVRTIEVLLDNLQRMLTSIPLTDEERAAVDDGQAALESLLGRSPSPPALHPSARRSASASPPAGR
jgi:hypothetical protein